MNENEYVNVNEHDNYPDSDKKVEIPTMKVLPLKKICMTIGELPSSYLETMTYYEMLIWFINYLRDNIIPTVNANGEAVEELQVLFVELQNYINNFKDSIDEDVENLEEYMNNYFENLDVQDEINNKLDQMLEDGDLEQIIEQFLQLTSLICFDNVQAMKESPNLTNGSFAKTLGYHSANDGGEATYKIRYITNDDVIDEMFIIEINDEQNQLIAELIIDDMINVKSLGAYGDGIHDDTNVFNKLNGKNILVPEGTYIVENLEYTGSTVLKGVNRYKSILKLKNNALTPRILTFTNGLGCSIKSIGFDGNKTNQTVRDNEYDACLTLHATEGLYKFDMCEISEIYITDSINNGLFLGASYEEGGVSYQYVWSFLMNDVYIRQCNKYGMYDRSSDNKFSNFKITDNGLGDLFCFQASSNTYVNFKLDGGSGYRGNSDSITENASLIIRNSAYINMVNLDVQSAWETGCKISGARCLTINGLVQNNGTRWKDEELDTNKHGLGIKLQYVYDSSFDITFGYQSHNQQTDITISDSSYNVSVLYQRDLLNQNYTPSIVNNSTRCYITEKKELTSLYNINFNYNPHLKPMTVQSVSSGIEQQTIDGETYYVVDSQGTTKGITFALDTSLEAGKTYYVIAKRKIVTPATSSTIGQKYPYFNIIDSSQAATATTNVTNISTDKVALLAYFTATAGGNQVRIYSNNNGVYGLNNFYLVKADLLNYSNTQDDMATFRSELISFADYSNYRISTSLNNIARLIEICSKNIK